MTDVHSACRRLEMALGTGLDGPREDQHTSMEEASRLRSTRRVDEDNLRPRDLEDAELICTIVYNSVTKQIRYER